MNERRKPLSEFKGASEAIRNAGIVNKISEKRGMSITIRSA